jgi:hypothetical protein
MGTAHSVERPGPQQRPLQKLVKPRTGSTSTSGLLNHNSFSNSTLLFSSPRLNAALPERPSSPAAPPINTKPLPSKPLPPIKLESPADDAKSQEQEDSKAGFREGRRRSIFRSRSSQRGSADKRSSSIGASISRVGERFGRSNSMTYESAIDSFYRRQNTERLVHLQVRAVPWCWN